MTLCLAFDTSAGHCAAALCKDGAILASRTDAMTRGQAEHLMPLLEDLLLTEGLVWRDLDVIGVGVGPGNFTGIRISVSAARGLALGLGVPAVGVTGFEALVLDRAERPLAAVIPGPRDRAYVQVFGDVNSAPDILTAEDLGALDCGTVSMDDITAEQLVRAMARIAETRALTETARPAPLYIRPADAAPARDPAPVIVP